MIREALAARLVHVQNCAMRSNSSNSDGCHHCGALNRCSKSEQATPVDTMKLLALWDALQVELHGQYPPRRIKALHAYTNSSNFLRVVLVCLLTPLPCIALVTLADFIPLNNPRLGIFDNYVFWLRDGLAVGMITISILEQMRHCLPRLPLSNCELLGITAIATTAGVGSQFSFAYLIGFPLPFSALFGELMWTPAVVMSSGFLWGKMLLRDRSLLIEMFEYVMVLMCLVALTLMYPAYIYVFNGLSGNWWQQVFVLMLPIMKIVTKNWIAYFLHDLDHLKPEIVIFNIEVFSALYVSCSLTRGSSTSTTVIVMAIDVMQILGSLYDIGQLNSKLQSIYHRASIDGAVKGVFKGHSVLDLCAEILEDPEVYNHGHFKPKRVDSFLYRTARRQTIAALTRVPQSSHALQEGPPHLAIKSAYKPSKPSIKPVSVSPLSTNTAAEPTGPATAMLGIPSVASRGFSSVWKMKSNAVVHSRFSAMSIDDRVLFVDTTARMLFLTEFVLLVEFTEVMMPIIYTMYLVVMSRVPNRQYYPRLAAVSQEDLLDTIGSVLVLATLELVSLIGFAIVIRRKLRVSPFHQVAFVLDKQFVSVQSKLILWMFYVVQTMLEHFGVDFSMKFAWLKGQKSP